MEPGVVTSEFTANFTIRTVVDYSRVGLPVDAAALSLKEVDGHSAQMEEDARKVESLCHRMGAVKLRVAQNAAERDKTWEARRIALSALAKPKTTVILENATCPGARFPQ